MFLHRIARRILAEIFVRLPIPKKKPVCKGVTVSLTSFPARLGSLHLVVRSLLKQTALPERIVKSTFFVYRFFSFPLSFLK